MKYKYKPGQQVKIMSYVGAENGIPAVVYSCYTSDKENHPAAPHNRYVVFKVINRAVRDVVDCLDDVSENELRGIDEL